ncbi:hypothetical protein NVP1101O_004 [Vibrio phage 1.101.O._10N.261.45.C6]|nr:hypothetical protein NVP1101O_004 [Vibrio phage 1.101.O._10N.261.45.C6]
MYRNEDDVVRSLHDGKTTQKNIRTLISKYRKKKDLETLIMFIRAIERYKMEIENT